MDVNDKATAEWLQSQKLSTRSGYKTYWKYFAEYVKMNGDQILADRKSDKEHKWERTVLAFKQWLIDEKKQSQYTATTSAMAVRGFFAFHYVPLQYRHTEGKKLSERTRKTEDYRFSREDLKKMVDVGDLMEKYVVVAGKSFGLRASDFLSLTRGDLEPYLNREPPVGIGEVGTGKEKVLAYPFIDADALPIIKLVIEQMNSKGRAKDADRILTYAWEKELAQVVKRLAKKASINTGNRQVRFHCLRKFLIDRLASVMSESKWKQIVGKKISEKAYVSPDSLREDYARAMAETCFTKIEGDQALFSRKEAAIQFLKMLGSNEEEITKIIKRQKTTASQIQALEEEAKKKQKPRTATDGDCSDGKHCQRIVSEEELPALLAEGFHVAAVLPSGKVVVEI